MTIVDEITYEEIKAAHDDRMSINKISKEFGIDWDEVDLIVRSYDYDTYMKIPNDHYRYQKIFTSAKRKSMGLPDTKFSKEFDKLSGRDWIRELVRIRDKRTCQLCGKKWRKGQRRFDVHHLDPEMDGKSRTKNVSQYDIYNFDKLITYCHKCHLNLDISREKMSGSRK